MASLNEETCTKCEKKIYLFYHNDIYLNKTPANTWLDINYLVYPNEMCLSCKCCFKCCEKPLKCVDCGSFDICYNCYQFATINIPFRDCDCCKLFDTIDSPLAKTTSIKGSPIPAHRPKCGNIVCFRCQYASPHLAIVRTTTRSSNSSSGNSSNFSNKNICSNSSSSSISSSSSRSKNISTLFQQPPPPQPPQQQCMYTENNFVIKKTLLFFPIINRCGCSNTIAQQKVGNIRCCCCCCIVVVVFL